MMPGSASLGFSAKDVLMDVLIGAGIVIDLEFVFVLEPVSVVIKDVSVCTVRVRMLVADAGKMGICCMGGGG